MEVGRVEISPCDMQSIGVSYKLNFFLGSVGQLALALLNCTLNYRWGEIKSRKRKETGVGKSSVYGTQGDWLD